MPRTAKPNRSDLNVPGPQGTPPGQGQPNGQPIQVPTGGAYGEAQALMNAQQAVPLPAQPPTPGGAPPAGPPTAPPPGGNFNQALEDAKNFQPPQLGALTRPTERPREPVTAGLPNGPAPITGPSPQTSANTVSAMLTRMGAATGSAALAQLAARAAAVGQ